MPITSPETTLQAEAVRAALLELECIEEELRRRRREQGMVFYIPNAMQYQAHQSDAQTILYVGGNRSGKSTWGAMELCFHLTREYPAWFSKSRRFTRPIKAVIVATEFPIVERAIEPKLFDYLPKAYIAKVKRTPQGYISRLVCVDGSTVDVLTNEMDSMAFESADWDFYWGDEPQQKSKYYAIRRGLVDRRGLAVLTFTPLIEPWMKADLVDKADGKRIQTFTVTLWDNHKDMQGHTILPADAIREFEADLPEDLRRTRVYGQFFHMRGIVYTEYRPEVHERVFGYTYPDPVICVLDPHERKPHWLLWAFVDRRDDVHVHSEMQMHASLAELKQKILVHEAQMGYSVRRRLIDPNFGQSPEAPGVSASVIQALSRPPFSVWFGEACDDKEAGRFAVKDYLHYDPTRPLSVTNKPKLWLHREAVPNTIRSLRNYQYADWVGKTRDERDVKEVQKEKDADGADLIRYLCLNRPTYDSLVARSQRHELEAAPY